MENFWKKKPLAEFTEQEWESVCMRCGKCCAEKGSLDGKIYFFNRVCDGLNLQTGFCDRYQKRLCADCAKVDMTLLQTEPELLPESCAYRILLAGKDLPEWHPLISGDPNSVRRAKQSILDQPKIHSTKDVFNAFEKVEREGAEKGWSPERIAEEMDRILEDFPLVPIEIQSISDKKTCL